VPEKGEGIAKRRPGVRLVRLRPEQGEYAVPTVEAPRGRDGQVDQQPESLGLGYEGVDALGIAAPQLQGAEGPQLDHENHVLLGRHSVRYARGRTGYDGGTPPL
jgi:hypothetical protein